MSIKVLYVGDTQVNVQTSMLIGVFYKAGRSAIAFLILALFALAVSVAYAVRGEKAKRSAA